MVVRNTCPVSAPTPSIISGSLSWNRLNSKEQQHLQQLINKSQNVFMGCRMLGVEPDTTREFVRHEHDIPLERSLGREFAKLRSSVARHLTHKAQLRSSLNNQLKRSSIQEFIWVLLDNPLEQTSRQIVPSSHTWDFTWANIRKKYVFGFFHGTTTQKYIYVITLNREWVSEKWMAYFESRKK